MPRTWRPWHASEGSSGRGASLGCPSGTFVRGAVPRPQLPLLGREGSARLVGAITRAPLQYPGAPVVAMCPSVPVLLATLLVAAPAAGSPLGCRDQSGAAVDWYVLYKLPVIHDTGAPFVSDGVGFLHFSAASTGERWTLSDVPINDSLSAAGRTLEPLYQHTVNKSLIYAFYNDEHPDGPTSFTKGHTKGVVAFDGDQGFWLVHSVPHFPPPPGQRYGYPHTGHHFGQSFLCVTLSSDQLETVARQLLFNEPYLYATQLAPVLKARYPLMARVVAGEEALPIALVQCAPAHHRRQACP
ncbi:Deoxyribonuclease-2 [Amphibalanus amphitrite]|uniref:Deoxyribonuclease-2 n=1 Tax=Amphibalanus amphitrite TaxID=1232801 RepID=A0A6A4WGX7_AMPAM|nr:Deoxyribonuclease-2 [Amphibalanus amphitrite]